MNGPHLPPPLVEELHPAPQPEDAWLALCQLPHCLFLDSALPHPTLGRYSFLAADPFDVLIAPAAAGQGGSDALALLEHKLQRYPAAALADLPPFQGGAAGLISYDFNRSLERVPAPRCDEFGVPALAMGLYDVVLAFDHAQQRAWIVSQGFPETSAEARRRRATERLAQMRQRLTAPRHSAAPGRDTHPLAVADLAPQFAAGGVSGLASNFSADAYRDAVRRAVDYIHAGDVFQVNLAQRLLYPAHGSAVELYRRLRRRNPATFAGYFDLGQFQIASASPERFLSVRGGHVEARPIKGTRQRTALPEADMYAGEGLLQSEKDRAENVMIVDLLRNDLSRVCTPNSVRVTQLCELETYQYVQHLVSAIVGDLAPGRTPLDLLRAAFPGGSITGAPKVRAMEIIAEIEPTARGAYCGSLGYIGFDGSLDLSILIRTITAGRGWWQLPVGGGIVAQSQPQDEYEETWHKARGLLQALQ
jgi:para-aminobenzoate synthetase component 1